MIKINLLSEGRRPVVARKAKPKLGMGGQELGNIMLFAGLIVGVVAVGIWWFMLNSKLKDIQSEVRRAQSEYDSLAHIIQEVEEYKAKQADLEAKVSVIKQLKNAQAGPVQIMDQVSRALPDLLWLDSMTVTGIAVDLRGKALNTNAVASFIENLDKVPEFDEPYTRNVRKSGGSEDTHYTFQITFNYKPIRPEGDDEGGGQTTSVGP